MYRLFLLIAVLPALVLCQEEELQKTTANIKECANKPFPNNIYVVGCDAAPCDMIRGTIGTTIVDHTVPSNTTTLTLSVNAVVAGIINVAYDLPEDVRNACNHIHENDFSTATECPLFEGDRIEYHVIQEVDKDAPTLFSPVLTFEVKGDNGETVLCYTWTANIKG